MRVSLPHAYLAQAFPHVRASLEESGEEPQVITQHSALWNGARSTGVWLLGGSSKCDVNS